MADDGTTEPSPTLSVEPLPSGGWAVKLGGHDVPVSRHDTEDEARAKAAAYQRGIEREPSPDKGDVESSTEGVGQ